MNISWNWLRELLDLTDIAPTEVYHQLTLAGFELESISKNSVNDIILDVSATTNRSDTTSFVGIAKEISSILQRKTTISQAQINLPISKHWIGINNLYQEEYIVSNINNIQLKQSPYWLQQRLALYNIQSINNLHDIINFIQIKWSENIQISDINQTSDNMPLDPSNLIQYCRAINPLKNTDTTQKYYNGMNIIVQLPIYATHIQENIHETYPYQEQTRCLYKNTSNHHAIEAYSEAILLITQLCNTKSPEQITHLSTYHKLIHPIYFDYDKSYQILGPIKDQDLIPANTADTIFHNLYFIHHSEKNISYIEIPHYRLQDVNRDIDLAEEISRIYGFNQFTDKIPTYTLRGRQKTSKYRLDQIRSICRSMGLHEVIHSSLGEAYNTKLYNPLSIEDNSLRNNLISKLIQRATYNIKQIKHSLEMFEIGRVFMQKSKYYAETIHMAGILGGNETIRSTWDTKPTHLNWFQAKGDLEELFERLNINIRWEKYEEKKLQSSILANTQKYFKLTQHAIIYSGSHKPIGVFGEIKNTDNNLYTTRPLYGFEIIIEPLLKTNLHNSSKQFATYTKYPSITRDIKIEVPHCWTVNKVLEDLRSIKNHIIESIELFDVYTDVNAQHKFKSLGFRITYSNPDSTLTTQEVNSIEQQFRDICISQQQY
uniref:phenylalanine--tRNA ligase n=1 Tax=Izziella formosana TaxID=1653389 RepID=A0A1G4NUU0_9FLOR|nr:Phenylalanine-tRNA ligase beta subunit [Izziella formosana]SCW22461.1 Phenylalanine-tRNA ligase beta subunit [Izziella formosana]